MMSDAKAAGVLARLTQAAPLVDLVAGTRVRSARASSAAPLPRPSRRTSPQPLCATSPPRPHRSASVAAMGEKKHALATRWARHVPASYDRRGARARLRGARATGELPVRWEKDATLWLQSWAPQIALSGTFVVTNYRAIFLLSDQARAAIARGPPGPEWKADVAVRAQPQMRATRRCPRPPSDARGTVKSHVAGGGAPPQSLAKVSTVFDPRALPLASILSVVKSGRASARTFDLYARVRRRDARACRTRPRNQC